MRSTKYIVIGRHDSERNSWIENGDIRHVVSCHNTPEAAGRALFPAHDSLGGCDGSDLLAQVARRLNPGEQISEDADIYAHNGRKYIVCEIYDTHECVAGHGYIGLAPKANE